MAVTYALAASITRKAGANIDSTYNDAASLLDFGLMAEGYINVASGYNWSDWYTAYSATYPDVAGVLVDAASNFAAIYVINCNMSGFTNIQEAVSRINTLYAHLSNDIALLKEESKKDFVRKGGGEYP